jgi:hypothetical protein
MVPLTVERLDCGLRRFLGEHPGDQHANSALPWLG